MPRHFRRKRWFSRKSPATRTVRPPSRGGLGRLHVNHLAIAVAVSGAATVALWLSFSGKWDWKPWAIAWLAAINGTALTFFGFDKVQARYNRLRVPEVVLLTLAALGGSVGSCLGMYLFRHKTLKGRFQSAIWGVVVIQLGILAAVLYHLIAQQG